MKILIVEDELPAVRTLKKILAEIPELEAEIVNCTDSVISTIEWLKNNPAPELIFMRSEEHTSELQSHSVISYSVFFLN